MDTEDANVDSSAEAAPVTGPAVTSAPPAQADDAPDRAERWSALPERVPATSTSADTEPDVLVDVDLEPMINPYWGA